MAYKKETVDALLRLLSERGELTTEEVESGLLDMGVRCSESAIRFLTGLKYKGVIDSGYSAERRAWVWYLPEGGD